MTLKVRILHSCTASENVLVAPGDGKFQTLIKKFDYFHQVQRIFFLYSSAVEKKFSQSFSQFFQHQPQRKKFSLLVSLRENFFLYSSAVEKIFSQSVEQRKGQINSFSQFFSISLREKFFLYSSALEKIFFSKADEQRKIFPGQQSKKKVKILHFHLQYRNVNPHLRRSRDW